MGESKAALVQLQAGGCWGARAAAVGADSDNLPFQLIFLVRSAQNNDIWQSKIIYAAVT